jgi:ribosomal protein S18 acetylase RimI-like enzyme
MQGSAREDPMPEIRISQLEPDDSEGLDLVYALYHAAILRSEQRPEAEFRALIQRPDYRFVVAKLDEAIIGFAVSWVPEQADFWLFEYTAVSPEARGNKIGSHLLLASRQLIGIERTALIEVDANTGSQEQAKRLEFYKRLGCRRLAGLAYLLPLDAFGQPPPMLLLAMLHPDVPSVPVMVLEEWLRRIYSEAYGKGLDDPRLARMIDPLPDEVPLEVL